MFANRNELSGLGENDPILDVGIVILDCILFVVELKLLKNASYMNVRLTIEINSTDELMTFQSLFV